MKQILVLLALLTGGGGAALTAAPPAGADPTNRLLLIEPSSMRMGTAKATLTIGPLQRAAGVYTGDYKIKVFPYFFKGEKGRLAIAVSDESLALAAAGKVVAITGTATTSGEKGKPRHVDATATPADRNRGQIKLWFLAGDRKMTFEPAYHFAGKPMVVAQSTPTKTKP